MSLTTAECRMNRGNAKGTITRASNQVGLFLKADITLLDLAALTRISESIERADDNFQHHHDMLRMELEGLTEDEYLQEGHNHQLLVSSVRININILKMRYSTTQAMQKLQTAVASLEIDARDGFTPCLIEDLPRVKIMNFSFQDTTSDLAISSDVIFIKAREDLSARIKAIDVLCRPHHRPPPGTPSSVDKAPGPQAHAIKISMPKFDGHMLHWKSFWSLFEAVLSKNPHLPSEAKRVLLLEAMDSPESKELAREALSYHPSYEEASARLRKNYENNKDLHTHHVARLLLPETFRNTRQDLRRLLHQLEKHTEGIRAANGYTVDQVIATHLASLLSPQLLSEWKRRTGKMTEPPALPLFKEFVEDQIHISSDPLDVKVDDDLPVSRKKQQSKPPSRAAFTAKKSGECKVCKVDHSVFTCPQFGDMTISERRTWAESEGVCFNCLDSSHQVDQC